MLKKNLKLILGLFLLFILVLIQSGDGDFKGAAAFTLYVAATYMLGYNIAYLYQHLKSNRFNIKSIATTNWKYYLISFTAVGFIYAGTYMLYGLFVLLGIACVAVVLLILLVADIMRGIFR